MTASKKSAAEATEPEVDLMTQPAPEGSTAPVTDAVVKPAVGVSPEEAFEMTKAPTPVNPPISIGAPGEPTPDQRKAAEKRASADGIKFEGDEDVREDAMVTALKAERESYERRGLTDRVKEVDEQIKLRTSPPKGRSTESKSST